MAIAIKINEEVAGKPREPEPKPVENPPENQ